MKTRRRNRTVSYVVLLLATLIVARGSYGKSLEAETQNLWNSKFQSNYMFSISPLQTPTMTLLSQDVDETDILMERARADRMQKELIADQISYGYLHGIVLAGVFALAGANLSKRASLIGGGLGMALGSAGAVYAIGENQTDFNRDNLFELPMFRIMDGGGLGLMTFGGALIGLGVFSPITAAIAYRTFKQDTPAIVHIEAGHFQYGIPAVSVRVSQLDEDRLETDLTTQLIRVCFK